MKINIQERSCYGWSIWMDFGPYRKFSAVRCYKKVRLIHFLYLWHWESRRTNDKLLSVLLVFFIWTIFVPAKSLYIWTLYIYLLKILRRLKLTGKLNKPCEMSPVLVWFLTFTWREVIYWRDLTYHPNHLNGNNRCVVRCMNTTLHADLHRVGARHIWWEMKFGSVPQVPVMSPFTGW